VRTNDVFHLELHTSAGAEAARFLFDLFGWRSEEVGAGAISYLSLGIGNRIAGGIVECGCPLAQWVPYVVVDNLEAETSRAAGLGATVLLKPREGPYGWRSVVDSQAGGRMALWQPKRDRRR
jgi:predicted enzyme related to lactoylglutathione lyase